MQSNGLLLMLTEIRFVQLIIGGLIGRSASQ